MTIFRDFLIASTAFMTLGATMAHADAPIGKDMPEKSPVKQYVAGNDGAKASAMPGNAGNIPLTVAGTAEALDRNPHFVPFSPLV